jgi:O-antigen ligase
MIAMVVSPAIKDIFFETPLGAIFTNGNSLNGIASGLTQSTAFGSDKSPGFFVNANVAGVWEATGLWITIFLLLARRSLLMIPIALLHAVAILAAGSKASAALLFLIPFVTAIVLFIFPPYGKQRHLLLGLCGGVTVFLIPYIVFTRFSQLHFVQASAQTFMSRSVMWHHAWEQFKIHPLLGQGFGGWTQSFAPVGYAYSYLGVRPDFPPHNSLIIVWSQSGLIALLLTLLLMGLLFRDALMPRLVPGGVTLSRCTFGAFLFIVVQAMGENYGVLGDVHIKIPLAVMLGWASTYGQRRPKR